MKINIHGNRIHQNHNFEMPSVMVDAEFETIWQQYQQALKDDKLDEDDKAKSVEELREEYTKIAERRVRLGLLLSEVGRLNNIEVSAEELNQAMIQEARRYPGQERQIMDHLQKNQQAIAGLRGPIFEDKVVDFILEMAEVTDRKVSIEELVALPEKSTEESTKRVAKKKPRRRKTAKAKGANESNTNK